uniref:Uncharacterized protein n=1 Tax=Arundo donax TaxID=35708 RepID=A0A0A8ZEE0_ARUDO
METRLPLRTTEASRIMYVGRSIMSAWRRSRMLRMWCMVHSLLTLIPHQFYLILELRILSYHLSMLKSIVYLWLE